MHMSFHLHQQLCIARYVKELMTAAGLKIREDAMGNIFGRWEGSNSGAGRNILACKPTSALLQCHPSCTQMVYLLQPL